MLNHTPRPRFDQDLASGSDSCRSQRWSSARLCLGGLWLAGLIWWVPGLTWGQEAAPNPTADVTPPAANTEATIEQEQKVDGSGQDNGKGQEPPFQLPKSWRRVTKDHEVWIDFSKKQVLVGGHICLREGMLEMFACPKGTKEHESIVAAHSPARFVHAALVAVGAKPGPPMQFNPEYRPAQGTEITVEVLWKNAAGEEQRTRAQEWVKHLKTGEELKYPWVFAGSGFWTDEEGKEQFYLGDGGEFICVSNFSTATLDLPVESSAANETLMFSAFTDRIPPLDTPVLLVLTPKLDPKTEGSAQEPAKESEKKPDSPPAGPAKEATSSPAPVAPAKDMETPAEFPAKKPADQQSPAEPKKDASC